MFLYLWCIAFPYFVFICFCISDILLFLYFLFRIYILFYILLSVISYFVFYIFLIRPSIFIVQSLQLLIEPRASMIIGKGFAQLISAKIGTNHLRGEGCFFIICICNFLYLYLIFCICILFLYLESYLLKVLHQIVKEGTFCRVSSQEQSRGRRFEWFPTKRKKPRFARKTFPKETKLLQSKHNRRCMEFPSFAPKTFFNKGNSFSVYNSAKLLQSKHDHR